VTAGQVEQRRRSGGALQMHMEFSLRRKLGCRQNRFRRAVDDFRIRSLAPQQ
jgi:hypothetical protein